MKIFVIVLIIILIVAGVVYSVGRSFKGKINFNNLLLLRPTSSRPVALQPATGSETNGENGSKSTSTSAKPDKTAQKATTAEPVPPSGFKVADLSLFYKKVSVSGFTRPSYTTSRVGKFTLRTSLKDGDEPIDITGWKIKGNRGGEVYVPQAIANYTPSASFTNSDIILGQGGSVSVYSNRSALGKNLRLNKCIGYLNNRYLFSPKLPSNCPSIDVKQSVTFSGECQSFLKAINRCEEPSAADKNRFTGPADAECRTFLDTLNYGGCYEKHKLDADFQSKEWRVWLDDEMPFDTQHDRLILFDKSGKVVNEYVY
ncbi:hypothetical protein A3D55_02685 [Candidatus Jorgensenbacteria bacterium RIFCSPHIGHO2_02_FULL_45_20]|uniref:LTD domain-containing protein n=2 Tax=Candidatus Joergenseniibacteriota TaxID=1752739 RepID=A0A1F6BR89_9BACT|nr:MAG: hypothetical protein UX22_C0007G0029 [Candidatus Jorgensenbacteria bacterium GW2011_GWA2_45_9]OGG39282.1 MAG: hypothetical protein A3D55_02685 [Candidatus Jorgensenbacteria bacterium RIFCSPHIGHO2_02_FULL_45_20]